MEHQLILRVLSKILIPAILLFALYVQFHAKYGPGGGFQAGLLAAGAIVLHGLVFDLDDTKRVLPAWLLRCGAALGVILFAGVGLVTMGLGAAYLDYGIFSAIPQRGQYLGIMLIEFGVLLTVFSTIVLAYYGFASHRPAAPEELDR